MVTTSQGTYRDTRSFANVVPGYIYRSLVILFLILSLFSTKARAERPGATDLFSYLLRLGPVTFSKAGGIFLPSQVLYGMRDGKVSPVLQFVLATHEMNACTADVVKRAPGRREPFVVASEKFRIGICRIKKCFQNAYLTLLLPQLSAQSRYGGSDQESEREASKQQALLLAQAFKKDPQCDGGNGANGGLDPLILQLITASR